MKKIMVSFVYLLTVICVFSEDLISFEENFIPSRMMYGYVSENLLLMKSDYPSKRIKCYSIDNNYILKYESNKAVSDSFYYDVAVSDNNVYVLNRAGITIWNYLNPSNPAKIGSVNLSHFYNLCIAGDYLFVSDFDYIKVYKITEAGALIYKTTLEMEYANFAVEYEGKYYISSYFRLNVYDVNERGEFNLIASVPHEMKSSELAKIIIRNGYLFMTGEEYIEDDGFEANVNSLLQVFKLDSDGIPVYEGAYSLYKRMKWSLVPDFANDFEVTDTKLYVSCPNEGLIEYDLLDNHVPSTGTVIEEGFQTVFRMMDSTHFISVNNTTSIKTLRLKDTFRTISEDRNVFLMAQDIIEIGDCKIICSLDGKIMIYREAIERENFVSSLVLPYPIFRAVKNGDLLFVSSLRKIYVLDFTNPELPLLVSETAYTPDDERCASCADIGNNGLFLGGQNTWYDTEVYDISDPTNVIIGSSLGYFSPFVVFKDKYLLCNGNIYDISDLTDLVSLHSKGSYDFDAAEEYGDYLFVANRDYLKSLQCSSVTSPVTCCSIPGYFADIDIKDTLLFALRWEPTQAMIFSISDPANPVLCGSIDVEAPHYKDLSARIFSTEDGFLVKHFELLSYKLNSLSGLQKNIVKEEVSTINIDAFIKNGRLFFRNVGGNQEANYQIIDMSGRIKMRDTVTIKAKGNTEIDVSSMPSGMYHLRIVYGMREIFKKIIKL